MLITISVVFLPGEKKEQSDEEKRLEKEEMKNLHFLMAVMTGGAMLVLIVFLLIARYKLLI